MQKNNLSNIFLEITYEQLAAIKKTEERIDENQKRYKDILPVLVIRLQKNELEDSEICFITKNDVHLNNKQVELILDTLGFNRNDEGMLPNNICFNKYDRIIDKIYGFTIKVFKFCVLHLNNDDEWSITLRHCPCFRVDQLASNCGTQVINSIQSSSTKKYYLDDNFIDLTGYTTNNGSNALRLAIIIAILCKSVNLIATTAYGIHKTFALKNGFTELYTFHNYNSGNVCTMRQMNLTNLIKPIVYNLSPDVIDYSYLISKKYLQDNEEFMKLIKS